MAETYGVVAVRYNAGNIHIDKLKAGVIKDGKLQDPKEFTRHQVVEAIKLRNKFVTLIKTTEGYNRGAEINVFPVETEYLKTKQDKSTKDNLESLPTF